MKNVTTIGIDLAKNVFVIHGVDKHGKAVLRKSLKRAQMQQFFANITPCLIGMEACGSAHHWARKLQAPGHTVRLMAPQFVKPYVKTNKNDARDAEAIAEAVTRPGMRFVPVKTTEQQALLSLHRARAGFVAARTAQANQIRGLLAEFGLVVAQGIHQLAPALPGILEDAENGLPDVARSVIARLGEHLQALDVQVKALDAEVNARCRGEAAAKRLSEVRGIGALTATALPATVGDARQFKSGRQMAAFLGLVPRQHSSGGKETLLGISKRGDVYLRTLLIHGARAVVRVAQKRIAEGRADPNDWLVRLLTRRHANIAIVALANKNARIAWALLTHPERRYEAKFDARHPQAA